MLIRNSYQRFYIPQTVLKTLDSYEMYNEPTQICVPSNVKF